MTSPMKGWANKAPGTQAERKTLDGQCGNHKCFIDEYNLKYPICPKCQGSQCSCRKSCAGLASAYSRAAQQDRSSIKCDAVRIARDEGCEWIGGDAAQESLNRCDI